MSRTYRNDDYLKGYQHETKSNRIRHERKVRGASHQVLRAITTDVDLFDEVMVPIRRRTGGWLTW